jgi:uncharacterized membrane protein HdeD (DUF308 family)
LYSRLFATDTVTYTSIADSRLGLAGSPWGAIWLGGVLALAGVFVLADALAAKDPSTLLFGLALLAAGTFEIVHTFWAPQAGAFLLRLLLGAFYAISGAMLTAYPLASPRVLTFACGAALIASGLVRLCLAREYWHRHGALLLSSGIVGILAGLIVLLKWPIDGFAALGLVVGSDLLLHGAWWVMLGFRFKQQPIRP